MSPDGGTLRCVRVTLSHGAYHLQYHIVRVAKYRRRILKPALDEQMIKRYAVNEGKQDLGQAELEI